MAISAGPLFKFNPSISFILNFDPSQDERAKEHLEVLWQKLSSGGTALMPLQVYPFSKLYGWIQDKYGVSWQLMLADPEGESRPFITPSLMFADFMLEGQWFAAMDSGVEQPFTFNEAISLLINCETQEEIDYYWEKLSAVPEAEQRGWLKDKYGVSWRVSPLVLGTMMRESTPEQAARITQAFLKMKKFDILLI